VEPVPETRVVLNQLVRHGETEIVAALAEMARLTAAIVPEIVGLSLGHVQHGLVFTLAASDVDTAVIDAAQYLGGGPCVEASTGAHTETWTLPEDPEELLDERRWAMYARASAAAGIASSLSLPLLSDGRAVGGVNLYASTPDAFDGHHEELAHALGTSASDAVTNADLSFRTRTEAAEAPERLAGNDDIQLAAGIIAQSHGLSLETARERLAEAAAQAGIAQVEAARAVIHTHTA
jgi:GAF domain-containing protein